jgi:hypothetical protein
MVVTSLDVRVTLRYPVFPDRSDLISGQNFSIDVSLAWLVAR